MIKIVHPFHPENGKVYELLGKSQSKFGERVTVLDDQGRKRVFSINMTDLYISTTSEHLADDHCFVLPLDDLLLLKELIDSISRSRKT